MGENEKGEERNRASELGEKLPPDAITNNAITALCGYVSLATVLQVACTTNIMT